ncbi:MAG: hypothetical protein L6R36_007167 [Xanthoria steineri]|nr:MAG: hypothetical protein L6R36_007167 [Xanthoria steineri]
MASRNPDSITNAQGEVHPSIPRDEPSTTHGHKPGVLVGNDTAPTFNAKTLPPGSAPTDRTFQPNNISETPSQASNPNVLPSQDKADTHTTASSTLGGATSGDVHTGLGKPVQGQNVHDRGGGLAGVGASGAASGNQMVDTEMQGGQRGLEKEGGVMAGKKGVKGSEVGADELPNERA